MLCVAKCRDVSVIKCTFTNIKSYEVLKHKIYCKTVKFDHVSFTDVSYLNWVQISEKVLYISIHLISITITHSPFGINNIDTLE